MRRYLLFPAVILLVLTSVAFSPAQVDRSAVDEVLRQVQGMRDLRAGSEVPVDYLNQDQLREKMIEEFEEENPEEEIRTASEIMVMLGFIQPDLDLYRLYIDLYTEQIAGFYDPQDKRLFLISEEQRMSAMDRYILAHELTHFLQDSNFDLLRPPFYDPPEAEEETDDDAAFAATCLVEGDAMLTSQLWLQRYMDASDMLEMQRESGEFSSEVLDSAPQYIRDGLLFPYQEGLNFVRYLHERGGFEEVNEAFRDPPTSTEQIYHPEKYLGGEDPVPLQLEDLSGKLGEGWELAYENVLGEFDFYELFEPHIGERAAGKAAAGWGGNIYHYYRHGDGGKVLVQLCAWDSDADTGEFIRAYADYLGDRFRSSLRREEARGAWEVWSSEGYMHALKKEGRNVYILQATGREPLEALLAGLGEAGEELEEDQLKAEAGGEEREETRDFGWLVIAGVAALFLLGIILVVVMLVLLRRPPGAPGTGPSSNYSGTGPEVYPPSPTAGGTGAFKTAPPAGPLPPTVPPPGSGEAPTIPPGPPPPPSSGTEKGEPDGAS